MSETQRFEHKEIECHLSPICQRYNSQEWIEFKEMFQQEYRFENFVRKRRNLVVRQLLNQDIFQYKTKQLIDIQQKSLEELILDQHLIDDLKNYELLGKQQKMNWTYTIKQLKYFTKIYELFNRDQTQYVRKNYSYFNQGNKPTQASSLYLKRTKAVLSNIQTQPGILSQVVLVNSINEQDSRSNQISQEMMTKIKDQNEQKEDQEIQIKNEIIFQHKPSSDYETLSQSPQSEFNSTLNLLEYTKSNLQINTYQKLVKCRSDTKAFEKQEFKNQKTFEAKGNIQRQHKQSLHTTLMKQLIQQMIKKPETIQERSYSPSIDYYEVGCKNILEQYLDKQVLKWKKEIFRGVPQVHCKMCEQKFDAYLLGYHTKLCLQKRNLIISNSENEEKILEISSPISIQGQKAKNWTDNFSNYIDPKDIKQIINNSQQFTGVQLKFLKEIQQIGRKAYQINVSN